MATLTTLLTRLEELDDDFMVFSAASTPPADADVEALGTELGVPLRADHRAIITALGSGAIVVKESVWPRPVEFEVRPAWQFSFGVEIFGIAPEQAPGVDVVRQSAARKPGSAEPFVAAVRRIGERGCVGYGADGRLVYCEPDGEPEAAPEGTLYDVLLGWLRTLEEDKERIKAAPGRDGDAKRSTRSAGAKGAREKTAGQWLAQLCDDSGDPNEVGDELMKEPAELRGQVIALVRDAIARARDADGEDEDEDEDDGEATDALWALSRIEDDERAVALLVDTATRGAGEVRKTAIGILGALDGKPSVAVAALVQALRDPDGDIVSEAAEALGSYSDPSAVSPLAEALATVQKNPRWVHGVVAGHVFTALGAAAAAGGAAERSRARAIEILTANLQPEDRYAALPAFRALITLGKKAEGAVPALERAAAGDDPYLGTLARHALGAITGNYRPHRAAIEAATKSKEGAVKAVADSALRDAKMSEILAN